MRITSGVITGAQKVVIYGPEGIGKSTFASKFPDPLFIDTEGSTKRLNIKRFDKPTSWQMIKEQIDFVILNPELCKTLIIDTVDWAEQLCIEQVCSKAGKTGIEDFGYGNGYVYEKEEFNRFLMLLDEVIAKGVNVVLTAHAQLRKFEQPDEMGAYDRWELKLGKKTSSQISPLIKEWADMVFFANYKTFAVATDDKGKKFKAQGGKRVLFTTHHPCWDAKNRDNLPEELPFEYESVAHLFSVNIDSPQSVNVTEQTSVQTVQHNDFTEILDEAPAEIYTPIQTTGKPDYIPKAVADLMEADEISEDEICKTVAARGMYPEGTHFSKYDEDFIKGWIIPFWDKIVEFTKANLR